MHTRVSYVGVTTYLYTYVPKKLSEHKNIATYNKYNAFLLEAINCQHVWNSAFCTNKVLAGPQSIMTLGA